MKLKDHPAIKRLAKELGLSRVFDAEKGIREYCVQRVEKIKKDFKEITGLDNFLEFVSRGLGLKFEEVHDDFELKEISEKYLRKGELLFKDLHSELDDETDALLFALGNIKLWEPKFVAVIDCRGYKASRAYFSKWHEIAHVLTTPPQYALPLRRTPSKKKEPEEQIADRVAGDLAFYSPLFLPEILARVGSKGMLTFEIVDDLRRTVCPAASKEATIRGAVSRAPFPHLLVIADYGLKRDEQRLLNSPQAGLFPQASAIFEEKLRAVEVIRNTAAQSAGLWIYPNMEVPPKSVITAAYEDTSSSLPHSGLENLDWWKHSRGKLETMPICVEARRIGSKVFAFIGKN
jgi:hypothetical protein